MGMTRQYVEQLSESIGPRPVASDTEREAAEWIRERFTEHGLSTTIQDFDTIRSLSGAHALYSLIPVVCVVLLGLTTQKWAALTWLLWAIIVVIAVLAWLDFSGRGSLSGAFPKGPSQNVIGRYVPMARPGEEITKIVLVAHYDTERSTPLTSEGIAGLGRLIISLAHGVIMLLPLFALVLVLPLKFLTGLEPNSWYALMVICLPVLIMFLNGLLASLAHRFSPGANNNASGVAALLSLCEDLAETTNPTSNAAPAESSSKFNTGALGGPLSGLSSSAPQASQSAGLLGEEASFDAGFDATFDFGVTSQASAGVGLGSSSSYGGASSYGGRGAAEASAAFERISAGAASERSGAPAAPAAASAAAADTTDYGFGAASAEPAPSSAGAEVLDQSVVGGFDAYDDYDARSTFVDANDAQPEVSVSPLRRSPASDFGETADLGRNTGLGASADAGMAGAGVIDSSATTGTLGADVISGAPVMQPTTSFEAVSSDSAVGPDYGASADDFAAFASGNTEDVPISIDALGPRSERKKNAKKAKKEKKSKPGRGKKKKGDEPLSFDDFGSVEQPAAWLGLDTDYDAREEGRKIGSWDNFPAGDGDGDDFDDGFTWKGGAAEGDLIEDEEYAATQAARIRRKISETLSVGMANKELWFVATSAHYVYSRGMRTFLEDYHEELRGALIINLASLGSGDLYWSANEQARKTYKSSAKLTALARRVAREKGVRAKPFKQGKLRTEAGWALADGRKAMSVLRLAHAGVPFAAASSQDIARRISPESIDEAVDFVTALIQEL